MKKIKLKESDLRRIVRRVINEQSVPIVPMSQLDDAITNYVMQGQQVRLIYTICVAGGNPAGLQTIGSNVSSSQCCRDYIKVMGGGHYPNDWAYGVNQIASFAFDTPGTYANPTNQYDPGPGNYPSGTGIITPSNGFKLGLFDDDASCQIDCVFDPNSSPTCTWGSTATQSTTCNPNAFSNYANFTSNFTNTVTNHNNPCNFLNQKITQFTNNLQGTGQGGYQNVQNCKLDLANQLHSQNNC